MIILTGEHKQKYLDMIKKSYENDEKLLSEDKDTFFYIIGGEENLENFNREMSKKKELYETLKDKEQIELDLDYHVSIDNNWIWLLAFLAFFSGKHEDIPTPNDDTLN